MGLPEIETLPAGAARSGVAVVTGAANGIGRAIVTRLAGAGWSVVGIDREAAALEDVLGGLGGAAVPGDVRDDAVLAEGRRVGEDLGVLRAWVNNAGIVRIAPLHLMDPETIDEVLDIDLRAVIFGTRTALQSFIARGVPGAIVNISSIHADGGFPGYGAYDAAKGGIEAFTRYVGVEYGHLGIRCNGVAPGAVNTSIAPLPDPDRPAPRSSWSAEDLAPMHRVSEPEEIAEAVAFLLGDGLVAINGHTLAVDNGMAAWNFSFVPDGSVSFSSTASPH